MFDQIIERIDIQAPQYAIAGHGDRGVAQGFGHQGLVAKVIARAQVKALAPERSSSIRLHLGFALLDDVKIIAGGVGLDDTLAGADFDIFQLGQQLVNGAVGQVRR